MKAKCHLRFIECGRPLLVEKCQHEVARTTRAMDLERENATKKFNRLSTGRNVAIARSYWQKCPSVFFLCLIFLFWDTPPATGGGWWSTNCPPTDVIIIPRRQCITKFVLSVLFYYPIWKEHSGSTWFSGKKAQIRSASRLAGSM